jgi:murein DD-endopeptidase MepM/ murein hydrolase activator NlpD
MRMPSRSGAEKGGFAEIRTGSIVHRHCHMLTKPDIVEEEQVAKGQAIGIVGTSEHSSGPHLHFEIHDVTGSGVATYDNVLSPLDFYEASV